MSRPYEPFTLPKYPELQDEINKLSMGAKLHYLVEEDVMNKEKLHTARNAHRKPTWEEVVDLLDKVNQVLISEVRTNPKRY